MDHCLSIFIGIIVIILMLYKKIPLWIIFSVSGILIVLSAYMDPFILFNIIYKVSIDKNTWDLVFIMYLISIFVSLYRRTKYIDRLGEELVNLLRRPRIIAMFTPAIMGLLPVPGGALMSIPIVDRVGDYLGLDHRRKLFINVWFRHVIFIVYPLSSVIILTAVLTNNSLWSIIYRQLPVAIVMIIIGYFIGFPLKSRKGLGELVLREPDKSVLLKTFTPIILSIVLALTTTSLLDYKPWSPINRLSMIIGVSSGILLLLYLSNTSAKKLLEIMVSREVLELALIGYTAMFMRGVFNSLELTCITNYLVIANKQLYIVLIPFLLSMIIGVVSSSVALSIPLLNSFINIDLENASLIYLSAFTGYLGSPLHLCYIYTAEYLKIPLVKGYRYMVPAIALTLLSAITIYMFT